MRTDMERYSFCFFFNDTATTEIYTLSLHAALPICPCAAGTAYIPGLADFVPMVKGRGSMALAGPHLVRAAVGEDVTQEELGGSRVHCRRSGVGDLEVPDDEACVAAIREYLSFMPSHNGEPPPRRPTEDPVDRRDDALLDVLPESNRKPYDVHEVKIG